MLKSNAENMEKEFLERLNQHRGIIYRISKVYMPDASERKDLVQEMVLQLWKSYATFKGDSSFSTWMYKVCLNTALTYVRGFLKHRDKHSESSCPLFLNCCLIFIRRRILHQNSST